jgi:hypothetical protein
MGLEIKFKRQFYPGPPLDFLFYLSRKKKGTILPSEVDVQSKNEFPYNLLFILPKIVTDP